MSPSQFARVSGLVGSPLPSVNPKLLQGRVGQIMSPAGGFRAFFGAPPAPPPSQLPHPPGPGSHLQNLRSVLSLSLSQHPARSLHPSLSDSCSPQAAAPDVPAGHDPFAPPAPPAPAPAAAAEPEVSAGTGPGPRGTGTCPASGVTCPPSLSLPVAPVCSRVPFFSCQPAPEPQRLRGGPRGPPEQPSGADP